LAIQTHESLRFQQLNQVPPFAVAHALHIDSEPAKRVAGWIHHLHEPGDRLIHAGNRLFQSLGRAIEIRDGVSERLSFPVRRRADFAQNAREALDDTVTAQDDRFYTSIPSLSCQTDRKSERVSTMFDRRVF